MAPILLQNYFGPSERPVRGPTRKSTQSSAKLEQSLDGLAVGVRESIDALADDKALTNCPPIARSKQHARSGKSKSTKAQ